MLVQADLRQFPAHSERHEKHAQHVVIEVAHAGCLRRRDAARPCEAAVPCISVICTTAARASGPARTATIVALCAGWYIYEIGALPENPNARRHGQANHHHSRRAGLPGAATSASQRHATAGDAGRHAARRRNAPIQWREASSGAASSGVSVPGLNGGRKPPPPLEGGRVRKHSGMPYRAVATRRQEPRVLPSPLGRAIRVS